MMFQRPAHAGDVLRIVTWLDEPRGARVERRYLVFRVDGFGMGVPMSARLVGADRALFEGERIVEAVTEWVFATEQGQPRRIPTEVMAVFRSEAGDRDPEDTR